MKQKASKALFVCWEEKELYLRVNELGSVSGAAVEINTLLVNAVPGNDSAIHSDWVTDVRRGYLDR